MAIASADLSPGLPRTSDAAAGWSYVSVTVPPYEDAPKVPSDLTLARRVAVALELRVPDDPKKRSGAASDEEGRSDCDTSESDEEEGEEFVKLCTAAGAPVLFLKVGGGTVLS